MQRSCLKNARTPGDTRGYASTVDATVQQGCSKTKVGGPVDVETNPEKIELLKKEGWLVSKCLWPDVKDGLKI